MFGTVQYNEARDREVNPEQGPEESPAIQEQRLRDWIQKQTENEERLEFNPSFKPVDDRFSARHDQDFLLPDAYTNFVLCPSNPSYTVCTVYRRLARSFPGWWIHGSDPGNWSTIVTSMPTISTEGREAFQLCRASLEWVIC